MIPYRGSEIAMVFQDPMTSLDPTMPVGRQIAEVIEMAELRKLQQTKADNKDEFNGPAGCSRCILGAGLSVAEETSPENDRKTIRETARKQAIELMRLVEIDNPELRYDQMPHHFSGGMRHQATPAGSSA